MSTESFGNDILEQYHQTCSKLKKRFLRKPNVTEACDAFAYLGQQCEYSELPAYAGLCWIAAARCEGSLTNISGETSCLVRAARQFLASELSDHDLGCPSPSMENLQAGLGCYTYASCRYPEDCPIPVNLNLEIVEFLKKVDRSDCVEDYLNSSIELSDDNIDTKIFCLESLALHYVESCDYTGALNGYTKIATLLSGLPVNGARATILLKCEINQILLLLILKPAPQKLLPNLAKLLEKYTWGDGNDQTLKACGMTEKMFLLLQSLVAVCQSMDTSNLVVLEGELWPLMENKERNLLRILVRIYHS